jgi:hypothetical protein
LLPPERTAERRTAVQAIADQYPHTRTGEFALFPGLTSSQLGDSTSAERIEAVVSSRNEDLAALAKLALAAVYRDSNRTKDAIDITTS